MNALEERKKNSEHITAYDGGGGIKSLSIDTRKVTYKGRKFNELSSFEKKKFENLLIISEPKQRLRFIYH